MDCAHLMEWGMGQRSKGWLEFQLNFIYVHDRCSCAQELGQVPGYASKSARHGPCPRRADNQTRTRKGNRGLGSAAHPETPSTSRVALPCTDPTQTGRTKQAVASSGICTLTLQGAGLGEALAAAGSPSAGLVHRGHFTRLALTSTAA